MNHQAKDELKNILEVAAMRDCCDVEIDSFREDAIKTAISALGALDQYIWERDLAIIQLEELGLHFGEDISRVRVLIDRDTEQEATYKHEDGTFVCPDCGASTYPLILYGGDFCQHCGKRIKVKGIIK